ncbi:nucleotidyltransferase family protein [Moritella sp.]|uniref:nucleotidyltransferase family protein n=1 Tax=Moritella sp. TaxID=78556 RepID=UPI001DEAE0B0|nr:nucleotidyltransferase family protein [Moritella sp.]MCJ8348889.1 nucleotidyltransferase family protein [Moritella sp.]NQZ38762.1 nucleotidyltransferase family protein [Moritella sp.]
MDRIITLIEKDELRVKALDCVQQLHLSQCYLAAGFVRNLVWDHLHQKSVSTPLNDVDVIYFDETEFNPENYRLIESELSLLMPELNWEVRNQAIMHKRNGDKPYLNIIHAMSYWPEKETAVAIRKLDDGSYDCIAAFGFESLFNLQVTHNPKRYLGIFSDRVSSKDWLIQWPNLRTVL